MSVTKIDGTRQIIASSITNSVQNFGTPSAATDVAIKSYVDSVAQGLSVKPSAKLATVAALSPTNTYSAGVLTATGVGILTVDGTATLLNDYILVMNEASGLKNGLYKVTTEGTAGVAYVLTRALEMDVSSEFTGAFVFVESGTVNLSSGWVCTNLAPTVGTTAITFTQFSGAGEITAGNGLTKTANTLDVVGTTNRISVAADSIDISSSYVGQATITTLGTVTTGTLGTGAVIAGVTMTLGSDATGDVYYRNSSGILTRIAAGAQNTLLTMGASSVPSWVAPAATAYQRSTVVSGTQDGANKVFTIANTVSSGSEQVFINGQLLMPGSSNDYVYNGTTTVTFQSGFTAPASTDVIRVYGTF